MIESERYDVIQKGLEEPHIGSESEGIVVDPVTFEVQHFIDGVHPTQAIKEQIRSVCSSNPFAPSESILPDVPEFIVETNPPPLRSPRSVAAVQRLFAILIDYVLRGSDTNLQLLHGAAWRPPMVTPDDVTKNGDPFKRLYYKHQIMEFGDKIAGAAGDHLNLSVPWYKEHSKNISALMIKLAGKMRLIGGALSIALSASSPLYTGGNGTQTIAQYHTILTSVLSARLGRVWKNRTDMDLSDLFKNEQSHRDGLKMLDLKSGRDLYLLIRAQAGAAPDMQSFSELCSELSMDLATPAGIEEAKKLLFQVFMHETDEEGGGSAGEKMQSWHRKMIENVINTPRNRVEMRAFETPFAFHDMTPYRYTKALYTFFDLLFIYLSEHPAFMENVVYDERALNSAKRNEELALEDGLDAQNTWIPERKRTTLREILKELLRKLEPVAGVLGGAEELELIQRLADGNLLSPALRIREEVCRAYQFSPGKIAYDRVLPDDSYPRELLRRSRSAMEKELEEIESDFSSFPEKDREYLTQLFHLVKKMRSDINAP